MYLLQFSLIPGVITATVIFAVLIIGSGYLDKNLLMEIIQIKNKNA